MKINELVKKGREIVKNMDYYEYYALFKEIFEGLSGKSFYKMLNHEEIEQDLADEIIDAIERYNEGEPIQYITNSVNFMGFNLFIKEGVFIPRPETENLVEYTLKRINHLKEPFLLDLCTGSGACAIAIAMLKKDAVIIASDVSEEAINVANKNIKRYNLTKRIFLIKGSLFEPLKKRRIFDGIVSNPPYIPSERIKNLSLNVRKEPLISLDGKEDGNYYVKEIIENGKRFIKKNGFMIIETDNVNIEINNERLRFETLYDFRGVKRFIKCEIL